MVNEQKYFDELQQILGETKSPDDERWDDVLSRLYESVIESAKELQTQIRYLKFEFLLNS